MPCFYVLRSIGNSSQVNYGQYRDLKPSNILFKGNTLKIIDFGLSKINHNLKSQCSDYVGTPPYMSWELLT